MLHEHADGASETGRSATRGGGRKIPALRRYRLDGREELRQQLAEKGSRLGEDASSVEYFLKAWQT